MNFNTLSINSFFEYALIGALFFLIFMVIERFLIPWIPQERLQWKIKFYYPAVRNSIWVLIVLEFIYKNAEENLYLTIAMLGLTVGLLWKLIKDAIIGIVFRFQKGDLRGQIMQVGDVSGEIFSYSNTRLNVKLENGEIVQIPFHEAGSAIMIRSAENKNLNSVHLHVKVTAGKDIESIKNEIRNLLINSPYVLSHQGIKIEQKELNNDIIELSVLVFTNNKSFKNNIQKRLYSLAY